MPIQVVMPQFGESVVEGTITRWLKSVGEPVKEFEPLLEVNTDKVDTEVPSPAKGVLEKILVSEGTTVQAGMIIAWIAPDEKDGSPDQPAPGAKTEANSSAPGLPAALASPGDESPVQVRLRDLGFISPVVAKIAQEQGVDLHLIKGTGMSGRITKRDILAFLEKRPPQPPPTSTETGLSAEAVLAAPHSAQPIPGEVLPLTPVRRAIAEHMVLSKRTSPHATTVMEADLSQIVVHRNANKDAFSRDGANLTYTAYFVAATISALKAYPLVNSSWSEAGILVHAEINIGLATSLGESGLIVPVIQRADGLSLLGIARAVNDLSSRARARQLKPEEVKGGTFTLTNHGTTGSLFAAPIINQPQCGILGVGAIQKRVIVISDEITGDSLAIRPMVYLSFTFDHRILDGSVADGFLAAVVKSLEHFQIN